MNNYKMGLAIGFLIGLVLIVIYVNGKGDDEIDPIDWCIPGANLTISTGDLLATENQSIVDETNFQVINLTTYKGRDVCQSEYVLDSGILIQYFTKKNDYVAFVYKNPSGEINEIEMNQSSFDVNNDDIVYDDNIIYDENIVYNDNYGENI